MTIYQLNVVRTIILKSLFVTPLAVLIAVLESEIEHQLLFTLLSRLVAQEYALLIDTERHQRLDQS